MTEEWFPFNDRNYVKDCLEDFLEAYSDLLQKISSEKEELKKEETQRASKADTSN